MFMTGIGSGIDFNAMIEVIVASERAPKDNQLDRQEGMNTAEIEALKAIQDSLNSFRDTVEDLNSITELNKLKAELSKDNILGVSIGAGALPGEYNFCVTQLAQAARDKLFTIEKGSYLSTGDISFTTDKGDVKVDIADLASQLKSDEENKLLKYREELAKEHGVDTTQSDWVATLESKLDADEKKNYDARVKESNDNITRLETQGVSVEELQSAINRHENADGAKVTLVQTDGKITMVLNAKDTGAANAVKELGVNGITGKTEDGRVVVPEDGSMGDSIQAAQNAIVKFGDMELISATNKMENVIDGVTLTLKEVGGVNVNITRDEDGVKETVTKFVDSYNAVMEAVNKYTKSSEDGAAALSGDAATRSMVTRLREVLSNEYDASVFQTLSQIGITTKQDGTLEIDQDKLEQAMEEDYDQIAALFMGDPSSPVPEKQDGLMTKMLTVLDDYHKNGGLFDVRIDRLEYENEDIAEQREALDLKMEARMVSLRDYYAKMDTQIAQMNQTQNMLIGMLM